MNNPYSEMYGIMEGAGKSEYPGFLLGTVITSSPLIIRAGSITITKAYKTTSINISTGNKVLIIPSGDLQEFAIISKVEEVS